MRIKSPINKTKDAGSGIKCLVYKSVLCIMRDSSAHVKKTDSPEGGQWSGGLEGGK